MRATTRGTDKIRALGDVALFESCTRKELARIASLADTVDIGQGSVLTREGSPGREFFVIADGEADVHIDGEVVARLGPGSHFGEMSLLDQGPRTATVTARTPMTMFVLDGRSFGTLLNEAPAVAKKLLRTLAIRIRDAEGATA
ncbi:MAG TPA: cyclic nucleotide-binding domain-containing protein [Actinomycetota bacterium]|nr:cyclic nucleotide-binding domain-containing protein [Actinomycetota bacterium]